MKKNLIVIGVLVVIGLISLSSCSKKEEVKKVAITKEEESGKEVESGKIDYTKIEDFSVLEKTWKPKNHAYPEPPEDLKDYSSGRESAEKARKSGQYTDKEIEKFENMWWIPYKYNGMEVWVHGSNSSSNGARIIYRKTCDNVADEKFDKNNDKLMVVKSGDAEPIYVLLTMLGAGDALVQDVKNGREVRNSTN